ncbi:MAG TPA: U32 family peptidase [Candidatus Binatia bacterium]|nr:U32 family peptidase [Candidatus Binatia bacterium]
MKLVVPAVYEESYLAAMAPLPISHYYGASAADAGLRANSDLPSIADDALAAYVSKIHAQDQRFFYCLNVACLGNREFTAEGQRWLVERLGWMSEIGCDGVVLSNPYLVAFAKKRFPSLLVAVSSANGIDSVDKVLYFQAQGVDVVYLPEYVNRDFPLLRQLCKRTSVRLVALANTGCMIQCPIRAYHSTITSHARASLELGAYVDYPLLWCTKEKLHDPAQMVKSPLIRPEDLHAYEELGIEEFKLAGREMDRPWNERVIHAYAARRHDSDLNDLILGFDQMEPYGNVTVRIPNRAMDGFIEFFHKKHDCRVGCRDCRYCDDWAANALCFSTDHDTFAARVRHALERFEAGEFRTVSGR